MGRSRNEIDRRKETAKKLCEEIDARFPSLTIEYRTFYEEICIDVANMFRTKVYNFSGARYKMLMHDEYTYTEAREYLTRAIEQDFSQTPILTKEDKMTIVGSIILKHRSQ